jgi:hypothetical protein
MSKEQYSKELYYIASLNSAEIIHDYFLPDPIAVYTKRIRDLHHAKAKVGLNENQLDGTTLAYSRPRNANVAVAGVSSARYKLSGRLARKEK